MSRDSFSGENLGHGPKKIENHWFRVYTIHNNIFIK